jgi:hypothetical protein
MLSTCTDNLVSEKLSYPYFRPNALFSSFFRDFSFKETHCVMACGSSCCGSVQTGITSLEDDVQEHPKPPARTADLSAFKASSTTRASSKIRNISSLRNCCCSPVRHDASITPPAQSGSRRSSNVPKSTPSVSKQCSKSTEADSCCGKRLPSVVTDASTSEGCCTTSVTEYPQPTANDNAARLPVSQNELAGCCAAQQV